MLNGDRLWTLWTAVRESERCVTGAGALVLAMANYFPPLAIASVHRLLSDAKSTSDEKFPKLKSHRQLPHIAVIQNT